MLFYQRQTLWLGCTESSGDGTSPAASSLFLRGLRPFLSTTLTPGQKPAPQHHMGGGAEAPRAPPRWRRGLREPRPRGGDATASRGTERPLGGAAEPRGAGCGNGMRDEGNETGERDAGGRVVAAEPGDVPGCQAASGDGTADRGDPAAPSAGGWPREAAEAALCSSEPAAAPVWARSCPASVG